MGFSPIPGEGGGIQLPTLPVPIVGSGGSGGVSAGAVNSALGSVITYIGSVLGFANSFAAGLVNALLAAVKAIGAQVAALFQYIAQTWLGDILRSMWGVIKTIWAAVQKELSYLIKLFRQYETLVRYWEQRILGPIINIIQALRKTLVIFRVFHLKFATQLDNYLSGIEGRLTNIFLWYQRELNSIINALNFIVDPFGLLSEALFIRSAVRSIGAVWAGVMGYPQSGSTAGLNSDSAASTAFYSAGATKTYMHGLAAGGTNPDDAAIIDAQRVGFAELGYRD
jgi:phage-related protein